MQKNFIRQSHFEPAARTVKDLTGLDVTNMSQATQEVLWSTAVQHGATGGARIFAQAAQAAMVAGDSSAPGFEHRLIEEVYAERSDRFASSTQRVQNAVRSRFQTEKQLALIMLHSTANLA